MKIEVRIPTEQYAYVNVVFDSLEEYKEEYPKFAVTMAETRKKAKEAVKEFEHNEPPF